ncbi:hypothetical protein ACIF84_21060 [Streptomyces albidoflavus]
MAGADGPWADLAATLPLLRHVTEPLALGGEVTGGRAAPLPVGAGGAMIVALDGPCSEARPELRRAFGASAAQLQWTGTGYLVAVVGLLVMAGRLGGRYGTCGCSVSA